MSPRPLRSFLILAALLAGASLAPAQPPRTELEQLRKPTTVPGYWAAIKAEINQGKFDTAAEYLKGLLALNPTEKDLLALEERDGIAAFLDLNNIPRWSNNDAVDREAKENVAKLVAQVTAAVKKLRSDPERIQRYIRNLTATPEERDYAFLELRKSGAVVMPQLIGTAQNADLRERAAILAILPRLDAATVPPLLAAFDIPNPTLRVEFINALQERRDILRLLGSSDTDPRPALWRLSTGNDLVASKAKTLLSSLTNTPAVRLPDATAELIKAAEDMYQHRNTFGKQGEITLWKWNGRQLVGTRATPSQAEEYFGLRYARWALEKEPANEAAQATFLSIALEKALERAGLEQRLAKSAPAVHELLAVAPASVLYLMLDRALKEDHLAVALGVTQVIGERAEARGKGHFDALVRALNSQDRRVALAAADALIRLPEGAGVGPRIVEVYRAALAAAPAAAGGAARPRAVIADPDALRAKFLAEVVEQAGFETVVTHTGRDTLRRLAEASDVDILWVNHELANPMLPEFLAQARADFRHGRLPLFVTVPVETVKSRLPEIEARLDRLEVQTRDWLQDEINLDEATKAVRKAQDNGEKQPAAPAVSRRLVIDRRKYPVRVDLHYDALRLSSAEHRLLAEWSDELLRQQPAVRRTTWQRQRILLAIARQVPGLNERLNALNAGLEQVKSRRVSDTLFELDLPSAAMPDVLAERLAALLREFGYEQLDGVRTRVLTLTREIPTTVSLTSVHAPPPQLSGRDLAAAPAPAQPPAAAERVEPAFNPEFERDKIRRAVPAAVEMRLRNLLASHRNVELLAEPLNPGEVAGAMRHMQLIAGPTAAPLSEAERKDHQRRAIDALRQMATGTLAGYDVRPATREILLAMRSDDLAPAAVEAAGRLPGKDVQQALAEVVVNTSRPAAVRRLAAEELVRHLQRFGATAVSDAQIASLVRLVDEEKNADVKAGIGLVVGALPRDRVLRNLPDPKAREAWANRLINYQPQPPAPPAPPPGNAKPEEPRPEDK